MRITISPTEDKSLNSISIETPSDHLVIDEVFSLIRAALVAWGFAEQTVDKYLEEE